MYKLWALCCKNLKSGLFSTKDPFDLDLEALAGTYSKIIYTRCDIMICGVLPIASNC